MILTGWLLCNESTAAAAMSWAVNPSRKDGETAPSVSTEVMNTSFNTTMHHLQFRNKTAAESDKDGQIRLLSFGHNQFGFVDIHDVKVT